MTDFKPGDQVRVQLDCEGTAVSDVFLTGRIRVALPDRQTLLVPAEYVTLIHPPLQKGDVIDEDTPCPEPGTALVMPSGSSRIWGTYKEDGQRAWLRECRYWLGAKVVAVGVEL